MSSSKNDQLQKIDEKIKQLQAQKQQFLNRIKEQDRKERTRRLIQIGAIIESMGIKTVEHANSFKEQLNNYPEFRTWLENLLENSETTKEEPIENP